MKSSTKKAKRLSEIRSEIVAIENLLSLSSFRHSFRLTLKIREKLELKYTKVIPLQPKQRGQYGDGQQ
jgi:hypothetical protein